MSRRSRATSIDVATAAKVSQATVSRAFAGGRVSAAVKARIFAAAEELHYRPDAVARSLTMGRSHMIALIVTNLTSLIYPELVYALTEQLAEQGYRVLLFTTSETRSEEQVLNTIWSHRVDGVISLAGLPDAIAARFARHGVPILLYNQRASTQVSSVSCDHQQAGLHLAELIGDRHYRKLAVLAGPETSFVSEQFLAGFTTGLAKRDIAHTVVHGPYSYEFGAAALAEIVSGGGATPDAVVSVNDTVAAGCLDHIRFTMGRSVPGDIAVVALNGRGPSLWRGYAITAMRQPTALMAQAAVETLLAKIESPDRPAEHRVFFSELYPGETADLGAA